MRNLLAGALFLIIAIQTAAGLYGVWWGLARGDCTITVTPAQTTETCSPDAAWVVASTVTVAGGLVALAGLKLTKLNPASGFGVILAGAVLGLPVTLMFVMAPVTLVLGAAVLSYTTARRRRLASLS
jgi:hypothetical protein